MTDEPLFDFTKAQTCSVCGNAMRRLGEPQLAWTCDVCKSETRVTFRPIEPEDGDADDF